MAFKFPSPASLGVGAIGDAVNGRGASGIAQGIANRASTAIADGLTSAAQRKLDAATIKLSKITGVGLGRTSVDRLLNDPLSAIGDLVGGGNSGLSSSRGGWLPKLQSRPDPLYEIDWQPVMPLGLLPEYVEEIQFTMPRIQASSGIPHLGSHIFIAERFDTGPITVVLYEDRLMTSTIWLMKWWSLIMPDGVHFGYPDSYKQTIQAIATDVAGVPVGEFTFEGVFLTTTPPVNLHSEGSSRVRFSVELSCDFISFRSLINGPQAPGGVMGGLGLASAAKGLMKDVAGGIAGRLAAPLAAPFDAVKSSLLSAQGAARSAIADVSNSIRASIKF